MSRPTTPVTQCVCIGAIRFAGWGWSYGFFNQGGCLSSRGQDVIPWDLLAEIDLFV